MLVSDPFMNRFLLRLSLFFLLTGLLAPVAPRALAQGCSLCASQTNGGDATQRTNYRGQTLNIGILYLAAVPYLAGGILGFMWYRNRRRLRQQTPAKR